ncbi:hypothetical protein Bca101_044964 [Brassica carinata]
MDKSYTSLVPTFPSSKNVYTRWAPQELGKRAFYLGVPFVAEWVRNQGHSWKSEINVAKGAFQLLQLQEESNRRFKKDGTGDAANSDLEHIQTNKETWSTLK